MEPVFRTLEIATQVAIRATGTRITFHGLENIPAAGGAVIVINHTSYIDFLPAALAAYHRNRRLRFMIKTEMQEVKVVGFLINGFAPLVDAVSWLKFASPFYYYAGHDPLGNGIDLADLAVLGAATAALMVIATLGFRHPDLRA